MTRNNCIRKEKKYALICIKVKCLQKKPMMFTLFVVQEQISIGKSIKLFS